MQPRDRLHEAQTKTEAGGAAAGVAAIEALGHLALLGIGDAGAVVGDCHLDAVADATGGHDDLASAMTELQRVLDQVGDRLGEHDGIAPDDRVAAALVSQRHRARLGHGLVELDGLRRHRRQIDRDEAGAARPGLQLGEPQQRVEDGDQAIDIGDGIIDLGEDSRGIRAVARQLLQSHPQQLRQQECAASPPLTLGGTLRSVHVRAGPMAGSPTRTGCACHNIVIAVQCLGSARTASGSVTSPGLFARLLMVAPTAGVSRKRWRPRRRWRRPRNKIMPGGTTP